MRIKRVKSFSEIELGLKAKMYQPKTVGTTPNC